MYNCLVVGIVLTICSVDSTFSYVCTGVVYIYNTLVGKLAILLMISEFGVIFCKNDMLVVTGSYE